jgi:sugar phosphate isomerase/epimerase
MKIATTTGDFGWHVEKDKDRIQELYNAGFRYIDLNMYRFTPDCVYMREGWEQEALALKKHAETLGMQFVQAHSQGGNPLSDDSEHVDFLLKATIRSIEICQILGIKNTVVHNGYRAGISKKEWFDLNKAFFEKLFCSITLSIIHQSCTRKHKKYRYRPINKHFY